MFKKLKPLKGVYLKPWKFFKRQSIKKKILIVVLLIIGFSAISQIIENLTKPPPYTVETVVRSDIVETVTESGNIVSSGRTDVFSPTNGVVTEVFVENGTFVEEGETLFAVKSAATDQEEKAAQANYLAAVSALNAAQSSANTLRALMFGEWKSFTDIATNSTYESDGRPDDENRKAAEFQIAQDEWVAAEKKYKDQQTAIAQAQAQVASLHALYMATQDSTVTAPVSGVVTNLGINYGTTVGIKSISLTGETTTPALILLSDYENEILLSLSETDVAKVASGQRAKIKVNAISDKEYEGVVNRVDSVGTDNQGVVTYNAYLTLLASDPSIRQGMTVDVEITTQELKDTLSVSNSSVKPYQGGRAVRVPDNSKPEKFRYVPVIVGVRGVEKTQILEGLSEGQEVVQTISNENIKRQGLFGS